MIEHLLKKHKALGLIASNENMAGHTEPNPKSLFRVAGCLCVTPRHVSFLRIKTECTALLTVRPGLFLSKADIGTGFVLPAPGDEETHTH